MDSDSKTEIRVDAKHEFWKLIGSIAAAGAFPRLALNISFNDDDVKSFFITNPGLLWEGCEVPEGCTLIPKGDGSFLFQCPGAEHSSLRASMGGGPCDRCTVP